MSDEELKALANAFRQKLALDPEIRAAEKKIAEGNADFSDTSRMFWRRSELLGDYMHGIVPDLAPEDRERLAEALLRMGYNDTNGVLVPLQEALDEPLGVHLTPVVPKYPAERVATVAHALMDPTVPEEKIVRRAGAPVANVNMSFHDKFMEENARIRAKLGMKPTITRYGSGCCKWCSEVAGRYRFGEQPKDIFRRHDNCGCTIIYDNQVLRGRETSSGRSKTWEEVDPKLVEAQGFTPTVNSPEQSEKFQENALNRLTLAGERDILEVSRYGFNPLSASSVVPILRNESQQWISALTKEEIRAIQKYTKNSGDPKDDKFYARLNSMLRGEISENDNLRYYAELVSSALQKYDLQHDIICYRKIDFDAYKDFGVGDIFQEKQFTSTSVSYSGSMKKQFTIIIKCPIGVTGAYIEQLSKYPNQREFLINKDSWFRVLEKGENSIVLEVLVK